MIQPLIIIIRVMMRVMMIIICPCCCFSSFSSSTAAEIPLSLSLLSLHEKFLRVYDDSDVCVCVTKTQGHFYARPFILAA